MPRSALLLRDWGPASRDGDTRWRADRVNLYPLHSKYRRGGNIDPITPYRNCNSAPRKEVAAVKSIIGYLNWLTGAIAAGPGACSKSVLVQLITGLSQLLAGSQFAIVDAVLGGLEPDKLSSEALLAIARTSFAARHKLVEWKPTVLRIKAEFDRRGADSASLLSGLL